ncbi:MAG: hypothetical protein ABIJ31_14450 [Pseudomonadota bacterium]
MEINNLQGAAAYTNTSSASLPVNNTNVQDQNIQASRTELDTQNARAVQEAFKVSFSQEAQNLQTEAATKQESAAQAKRQEQARMQTAVTQNGNTIVSASQASQIINIVA